MEVLGSTGYSHRFRTDNAHRATYDTVGGMPKISQELVWSKIRRRSHSEMIERSASVPVALSSTSIAMEVASHDFRRTRMSSLTRIALSAVVVLFSLIITPAEAVFISNYENCLSTAYQSTAALQFTPTFVDVVFNTSSQPHNLRMIVYGNVSGSVLAVTLPPANSSDWTDPTVTDGKIVNLTASTNKLTTLSSKLEFLNSELFSSSVAFCSDLSNGTCPLAPVFEGNK